MQDVLRARSPVLSVEIVEYGEHLIGDEFGRSSPPRSTLNPTGRFSSAGSRTTMSLGSLVGTRQGLFDEVTLRVNDDDAASGDDVLDDDIQQECRLAYTCWTEHMQVLKRVSETQRKRPFSAGVSGDGDEPSACARPFRRTGSSRAPSGRAPGRLAAERPTAGGRSALLILMAIRASFSGGPGGPSTLSGFILLQANMHAGRSRLLRRAARNP